MVRLDPPPSYSGIWKKHFSFGKNLIKFNSNLCDKHSFKVIGKFYVSTAGYAPLMKLFVNNSLQLKVVKVACNFIKKETLVQVFSREFCGIFKNTFFIEYLCWLLLVIHPYDDNHLTFFSFFLFGAATRGSSVTKGVLRNFRKIHRKTLVPESLF